MGIAYWPIGQLRTNKFELANFVLAYLNNGSFNYYQILDSSTISLIFSDHLGDPLPWGGEQGLLWYSDPGLANTPWGHEGGWIGCQTAMYLSREENWGVLFFINWANSGSYSPGFYPTLIQIVDYANLITDAVEYIPQLIKFNLDQNYPNPFNPSTKIKYSVTQSSNVVIKVFDVLGNEIETLVSEEKTAGTYELTWNAANLPSGVYFYQLSAGDYLETKKMVLIR